MRVRGDQRPECAGAGGMQVLRDPPKVSPFLQVSDLQLEVSDSAQQHSCGRRKQTSGILQYAFSCEVSRRTNDFQRNLGVIFDPSYLRPARTARPNSNQHVRTMRSDNKTPTSTLSIKEAQLSWKWTSEFLVIESWLMEILNVLHVQTSLFCSELD